MNNSNAPVSPVKNDEDFEDYFWGESKGYKIGLTKREYFAGLAMQAIVSADVEMNIKEYQIAAMSVRQADALLAKLEETNDH